MVFVSINTWKCDGNYHRRLSLMTEELLGLSVDIIAAQEVFHAPSTETSTKNHLTDYLGLANYYLPLRRKKRALDNQTVDSYSGLCFFTNLPVVCHDHFMLPSHPADGERAAQLLVIKQNEKKIALVNTHLTHLSDQSNLRLQQVRTILGQVTQDTDWDAVIIAGDFNALPDSPVVTEVNHLMVDAFSRHIQPTHRSGKRIDYIFYTPDAGLKVVEQKRVLDQAEYGIYPSDHYGLLVKFDIE
ncbi:MAG: endonuclease/exonuclease/phosphatase family protein [Bacteroidota bacterium]